MADLLHDRRIPLLATTTGVQPLPPAARWILRGAAEARAAAQSAFQVAIPDEACRAAAVGERAALWLGPDEWLLIAPAAEAETLGAALAAALAGVPHSLVDVSHRQVALELAAPEADAAARRRLPARSRSRRFPGRHVHTHHAGQG